MGDATREHWHLLMEHHVTQRHVCRTCGPCRFTAQALSALVELTLANLTAHAEPGTDPGFAAARPIVFGFFVDEDVEPSLGVEFACAGRCVLERGVSEPAHA